MEYTPTTTRRLTSDAKLENSTIFGLYYLEEQELELSEVAGCFGAGGVSGPGNTTMTATCSPDDCDELVVSQ